LKKNYFLQKLRKFLKDDSRKSKAWENTLAQKNYAEIFFRLDSVVKINPKDHKDDLKKSKNQTGKNFEVGRC
jgi:hypothetical protein